MKMTIIGGGNIGTLLAAEMAAKGHEITVYTSKPERWSKRIKVLDADENILLTGEVSKITDDLALAVRESEMIWITIPAQAFETLAKDIEPFVSEGQKIGIVPGSGGAEYAFCHILRRGIILFGLQRVHSIARLKEYGKSVYMLGRKPEIQIAAIPAKEAGGIADTITRLLDMPCAVLPNYLNVTLIPSNSILHTARLYTMFRDYKDGAVYPRNFLFYEEWDDESSKMLLACDRELQDLCARIPLPLDMVKSLKKHYESETVEAMTEKIRGIKAFRGLTSPMKKTAEGWVPDFESRYFVADFPYGLEVIREIAKLFEVPTPYMDIVWNWYEKICPNLMVFTLKISKEEFLKIYI